jgi:CDP-diacylglycerol--serine O-phosphatidyltransferase
MVSTHRYLSFKQINISREKKFQVLVGMVLLLILLATEPPITLFIVSFIYIFSGPAMAVYGFLTQQKKKLSIEKTSEET